MLSTQEYLRQVSTTHQEVKNTYSSLEKKAEWIHNHPLTVKLLRIFVNVLSISAIALAFSLASVSLGVVGLAGIIANEYVRQTLESYGLLASSGKRPFKPAFCEGGSLYYQGNVPILTLEADDPFKAGKAHGYLLAEPILRLAERAKTTFDLPSPIAVPHTLAEIRQAIPESYMKEMEGMATGINEWIDNQWWYRKYPKVTADEILLSQLIPDSLYFRCQGNEQVCRTNAQQIACTVVMGKNERSGLVFGRNMDWPSMGLAGDYSLVVNRKYRSGKHSTAEIGIPGLVGTLTGMNATGFSVAMNVCGKGRNHRGGIPAALYNRMVLENCRSPKEASHFVARHHPLGSYHLSVADAQGGQSFHFYQDKRSKHVTRTLERGKPLVVTNCSYDGSYQSNHMHYSSEREKILSDYFKKAKKQIRPGEKDLEALVAHSLTLPYVNNVITTHTVEMIPARRIMRVAFDNSYSASKPLQEIDTTRLPS